MYESTKIIDLGSDGFSLIFDPSLADRSLDGHTWGALLEAHCEKEHFTLKDVIFDPESDMFAVHSPDKKSLESLANVIEQLLRNPKALEAALSGASDIRKSDDDMTTHEFIEWMREAGFDFTSRQIFDFGFDCFRDQDHADAVKEALSKEGYESKIENLGGDIFFTVVVVTLPIESELVAIEATFARIAREYGVEYAGFGVDMSG